MRRKRALPFVLGGVRVVGVVLSAKYLRPRCLFGRGVLTRSVWAWQYVDNGMHCMGLTVDSNSFKEYIDQQSGDPWDNWKAEYGFQNNMPQ